jgi:cation transport ATPase
MKTRRLVLALFITALVLTVILISYRAYYIGLALLAGTLLLGYRELWSVARGKKLPVVDERVKENANRSVRNGFIFFVIASACLMLLFSVNINLQLDTIHVLGGLFVAAGAVYLLSYIFYDRAEPKLNERRLKMVKTFLVVAGVSVAVFIVSAVLHNVISGVFNIEEPVFFFLAVFMAPLGLAVGLLGSLVVFLWGLFSKAS